MHLSAGWSSTWHWSVAELPSPQYLSFILAFTKLANLLFLVSVLIEIGVENLVCIEKGDAILLV